MIVESPVGAGEDDEEMTDDVLLFSVAELGDCTESVSTGVSPATTVVVTSFDGVETPVNILPLVPSSLV